MTREELLSEILAARPMAGDLVYIERRGAEYAWSLAAPGAHGSAVRARDEILPDAWIYYSGRWPFEDPDRWRAFTDDLFDEMESMASGGDRCRWPLDEPWPRRH